MDSIVRRRAQRFLYLRLLYDKSDGRESESFGFNALGQELGWDDATTDSVTDYLVNEGLARYPHYGGIELTHYGLKAVEAALTDPNSPTDYFPPASIVVVLNGSFVIKGDVIGRDKTVNNSAGGDIVGGDKQSPEL